ncbi:MAG: hypothetical protein EZS28_037984, partial [Streblomastix strix]
MEHESSSSFQITHEKQLLQKQGYQVLKTLGSGGFGKYGTLMTF